MIKKVLGPPGTGKTMTLLNEVNNYLVKGVPLNKIGYFAFTRKAAAEDSVGTERIAALVCRRIIHHDSIAVAMLWPYHACLPSHECDSPSFVVLVHWRIIPTTVIFVDCKNR